MQIQVAGINVTGLKASVLCNVGLLELFLKEGSADVVQINMVTQVTKKDDQFMKEIFNPLE